MKKFKEINDKNDPKMPLSLKNYCRESSPRHSS